MPAKEPTNRLLLTGAENGIEFNVNKFETVRFVVEAFAKVV